MTDSERIAQLERKCAALQKVLERFVEFAGKVQPMYKEWEGGTGKFAGVSAAEQPSAPSPGQRKHITYAMAHEVRRERAEHPEESVRALARRLNIPESTVRSCLKLDDRRMRELKKKDMRSADEAYRLTGGDA
ncbi:TPA: hypothetical protein JLM98_004040 [Escherichia coli]|uniref:hypothetical protein n=1 Tax=Escherichia coli TaxID=562 RepID=UPI00199235BD|nr:hypothetical protein [Escherichia coli]EET3989931.1 hypothetical protein [Escherichia coli]EET8268977.1 hypothetical protein [Escherichia coli]EEU3517273.1 hypothetical protein [Escherichia coli]EIC4510148.1 hypothetical protein [Escherichia coli]EIT9129486.1 hypothetical protein [Escherichia coli]